MVREQMAPRPWWVGALAVLARVVRSRTLAGWVRRREQARRRDPGLRLLLAVASVARSPEERAAP